MAISRINDKWLNPIFVSNRVKSQIEPKMIWESMFPHETLPTPDYSYEIEQYVDIETPNDSAMGRTLDPKGRKQQKRGDSGLFPHTGMSGPKRAFLELNEEGLEIDYTDGERKYPGKAGKILKKQNKLGRQFASGMNSYFGDTITESWATSPTGIQKLVISSGKEWSLGPVTGVDPIKDVLDATEKIDTVGEQYGYKAATLMVNRESFYDLTYIFAKQNYELGFEKPDSFIGKIPQMDLTLAVSPMVKKDFAIVGDFASAGVVLESDPLQVETYETEENKIMHTRVFRTYGMAITDPMAICSIVNTVG
jgi:hypothetical protein